MIGGTKDNLLWRAAMFLKHLVKYSTVTNIWSRIFIYDIVVPMYAKEKSPFVIMLLDRHWPNVCDFGPVFLRCQIWHWTNVLLTFPQCHIYIGQTLDQCSKHYINAGVMLGQYQKIIHTQLGQRNNKLGQHWPDGQNCFGPRPFSNIGPM